MKIAIKDGEIILRELTSDQYRIIKSWNIMQWKKAEQLLRGRASMALLDKLTVLGKLPPNIEAERTRLRSKQSAVDRERLAQNPTEFIKPPVKVNLFEHQKRALNMALLTFEWVTPDGRANDGSIH